MVLGECIALIHDFSLCFLIKEAEYVKNTNTLIKHSLKLQIWTDPLKDIDT